MIQNILKEAISTYGEKNQISMVIEELSELITTICHYERDRATIIDVASEIADVEIMLEQLKLIYKIDDRLLNREKRRKLERLKKRIEGGSDADI